MLNIIRGNESAIIVLHEIYGINPHIRGICEHYASVGFDVLCPDFLNIRDYFDYSREGEAYEYFRKHIGFPSMVHEVKTILMNARTNYKKVFLLGFSVGATAAWICSEKENPAEGVICYYGSRIRDFQNTTPKCPILLIFAKEEKSFNVLELSCALRQKPFVDVQVLKGKHGFSDPFSKSFNEQSQQIAQNLVDSFLLNLIH